MINKKFNFEAFKKRMMTESYEIKNSRNCTIHAKCESNSTVLLY